MNFEEYYEQEIGEPWSDLERRVLARHPFIAAMARPQRIRFAWWPKRVQRSRGIPMTRIVWLWWREN